MFDIGFGEMVLLAAIALIAIGPKQLPEVARAVGKLLGELKKTVGEVTSTVASVREETDRAIQKVTHDLVDITQDINKDLARGLDMGVQKQPDAKPIVPMAPHEGDPPWVVNPSIPNPNEVSIIPATGAAPFAMAPARVTVAVPATKPSDGEST